MLLKSRATQLLTALLLTSTVSAQAQQAPYLDPKLPVEERVKDLLSRMTLEDKVGQMTQAERGNIKNLDDIGFYGFGSILSGGGSVPGENTPEGWANMIDAFQRKALEAPLKIPMLYGIDAVHGHNNVYGATIFPHNLGLGATRNPELVRKIGQATAAEVYATGIRWNFAPCVCVARDERWGRTYESYGEDPEIATAMTTIIEGMQGDYGKGTVLATAKHFVADGGTLLDSSTTGNYSLDQGDARITEEELRKVHLPPYKAAIEKGVGSVMASFSSWNGLKLHAHKYLLTDVLKNELGFKGFVISDWAGIDQISPDPARNVREAINAGVDMVMEPNNYARFVDNLTAEIKNGNIPMSRIDDAVSRILTQKFKLGLFEQPFTDRSYFDQLGSQEHRDLARQAVRESLVLLKNEGVLPIKKDTPKILVAGSNADDIGNQAGGWTISWQGKSGDIIPGTTILQGIKNTVSANTKVDYVKWPEADEAKGYDFGVVVVGERPYAEGQGDKMDLGLGDGDRRAIQNVCSAMKCVVVVVSGRPMILTDDLPRMNALVAAWLPGSEGQGVADVLFGDHNFTGKLPITWPRSMDQLPINVGDAKYDPLFAYGFGLKY
ncbi:glycoside hydrolase family 3 protein [Deinococcus cellulosilyticus]|uniref:beta-glucosidase n=1 Tax=Deinococcus cellulosilyticus (strain DSM 18568 / NBRC 106333 / KACC 11606 / 5516J-15) TaxID=1223518 RepID=A0A511N896_DEIC1|nr:glycoside hydrolase family 3 protein [Deinococcus cellulosilyticus]GEM48737.1 beta-glucosidase [Deinococcus cellulosilyticus NBRC 106333 = KACC 11606]